MSTDRGRDSALESERKLNVVATFMKDVEALSHGEFVYDFRDSSCELSGLDIFMRYTRHGWIGQKKRWLLEIKTKCYSPELDYYWNDRVQVPVEVFLKSARVPPYLKRSVLFNLDIFEW